MSPPVLLLLALAVALIALAVVLGVNHALEQNRVTYCARGGYVSWQPDAPDQRYAVTCVRTRP